MTALAFVACRLCGARAGRERMLDLGHHPLADRFLSPADLARPEITYPLVVDLCASCGYVGLAHVVSAIERYQAAEYSYTASNSPVAMRHFAELATACVARCQLTPRSLAVDIGGNDGTFLHEIALATGCRTLNVEPSQAMAVISHNIGIEPYRDFWNDDAADFVIDRGGATLIACTNALNHADDPVAAVKGMARALARGGVVAIEVPSLRRLLDQRAFDTVYLEHVSYFSLATLVAVLEHAELGVVHAETIDYMGGSLRVFAKASHAHADDVMAQIAIERMHELLDPATYAPLARDARRIRDCIVENVIDARIAGAEIVGFGAAAKGNTLLNYCRLDADRIACIADSSPHKIGKLTPGSHIPIVADDAVPATATHALILPWNIAPFLRDKIAAMHPQIGTVWCPGEWINL